MANGIISLLKINLNRSSLSSTLLTLSLAASAFGLAPQDRQAQRVRWIMGTVCELDAPGVPDAVVSAAFAEIERWDRILSLYTEDSEAATLNRAAGTGPVNISPDLYAAVSASLHLARETGGAFDPTIFPVLRGGPAQLPLIGWGKVRLDPKARTIELPAGMGLDFGGIGKGWALDKAAAVLKQNGVTRARFNFGGQILAIGAPDGAEGWPVTIPGRAEPLLVKDASVSVSGDSEHPGHIKSPFDGLAVRRPGAAVAILDSATEADAWSTALFILGKTPPSFRGRSLFVDLAPATPVLTPENAKLDELARKVDILTQEIEKLKLGEAADSISEVPTSSAISGFAPAASKVYRTRPNKVSIGGYGEMTYQNFSKRKQNADPASVRDEADFLRAVLYIGYKFNDWILFNSETEFEHGSTGKGRGEVSVEMAYVDFRLLDAIGIRIGTILVPMGLQNEIHEPTTFHGVRRTSVEQNIIPSTWRENGAGIFGDIGAISYRSYLVSGLQATTNTGVTGFSSSSGLRNGRSSGAKSYAEDLACVTRIDYKPVSGVLVGGSFYFGQADQSLVGNAVPVTLWEGHLKAEHRGAELRALYAAGRVGNAHTVNSAQGILNTMTTSVGSKLFGGYVEGAYDVLTLVNNNRGHLLSPFIRYERYDTQAQTPSSFAKNTANSRVEYTLGVTYKPIPQVAVKADHQWLLNQAHTGVNQWNLGLAYIF